MRKQRWQMSRNLTRAVQRVAMVLVTVVVGACTEHSPPSGFITTSDNATLYYKVLGTGTDTLIAIHGGPGMDLESIYADFAPLTAKHVVIFYDQRGGGKSELPDDTTRLFAQRQIQDLDEVRQHFKLARVALVAHSYGPLLAASYALAHPDAVSRMVFFGPVPPYRGDFFSRYGATLNARLDSTQHAAMDVANGIRNDPAASDSAVRQACRDYWALGLRPRLAEPDRTLPLIKSDFCVTDLAGLRYGNRVSGGVILGSYGDWDLRPQLASLTVPLLVVHGETEAIPMDMVEQWATVMPNASLLKVPNAGHVVYVEQPEMVWPAVETFLAKR
jgi:proline iminopeptidase